MPYEVIWFFILAIVYVGYAVLDGFDLGIGIIHLFTKGEENKRANILAIGPVWDGNEVWLVTAIGGLFAAFPIAYSIALSGLYPLVMLFIACLVFRGISIEFRSRVKHILLKKFFDFAFGFSSLLMSFIFGITAANIFMGLPIGKNLQLTGIATGIFSPYAILLGLLSVSIFTIHGAIFLQGKVDELRRQSLKKFIKRFWSVYFILILLSTVASISKSSHSWQSIASNMWFWISVVLLFSFAILLLFVLSFNIISFWISALVIVSMAGLSATMIFPNILISSIDPAFNLTIYNAASEVMTLKIMFIIACIGVPLILTYTSMVYYIFRGQVKIKSEY